MLGYFQRERRLPDRGPTADDYQVALLKTRRIFVQFAIPGTYAGYAVFVVSQARDHRHAVFYDFLEGGEGGLELHVRDVEYRLFGVVQKLVGVRGILVD